MSGAHLPGAVPGRTGSPGQTAADGTIRRLRALMVIGWPAAELAARLRVDGGHIEQLVTGQARMVTEDLAAEVAVLYDTLSPIAGPSLATAGRSHAMGWLPPSAWAAEDLDDPAAAAARRSPRPPGRRSRPAGRSAGPAVPPVTISVLSSQPARWLYTALRPATRPAGPPGAGSVQLVIADSAFRAQVTLPGNTARQLAAIIQESSGAGAAARQYEPTPAQRLWIALDAAMPPQAADGDRSVHLSISDAAAAIGLTMTAAQARQLTTMINLAAMRGTWPARRRSAA